MNDKYRGVDNRRASTQDSRGLSMQRRLVPRCHRHKLTVPRSFEEFQAEVEAWIATCVMSRTKVGGEAVHRERQLVRGNASLATVWTRVRSMAGRSIVIHADYVWAGTRVTDIVFSVPGVKPVGPTPVAPTLVDPKTPTPTTPQRPPDPTSPPPPERVRRKKKPIKIVDPPISLPPTIDVRTYVEHAKRFLRYLESIDGDPQQIAQLTAAIFAVEGLLLGMAIIVGKLFWDTAATALVVSLDGLHHAEARALSRFDHMGKLKELENKLKDLQRSVERGHRSAEDLRRREEERQRKREPDDEDEEEKGVVLYHGTTLYRAQAVTRSGGFAAVKTYFASTRSLARFFAERKATQTPNEGAATVLRVEIPEDIFNQLRQLGLLRPEGFDPGDRADLRTQVQWVLEPGGVGMLNKMLWDIRID